MTKCKDEEVEFICLMMCVHVIGGASVYLDEVARDVPAGDVQAPGQVRQAEALVHWADVCHAVARVHHHPSQQA